MRMIPKDGTAFVCRPGGEMEKELLGRPGEWTSLLRETGTLPPLRGLRRHELLLSLQDEEDIVHVLVLALGGSFLVTASHGPGETGDLLSKVAESLPEGLAAEIGASQAAVGEAGDHGDAASLMNEMTRLNNKLVALQREMARKKAELERLNREVREMSITDDLTGVLNRRGFVEAAGKEVARCRRYQRTLSTMMLDIDHFKRINDTYGHGFGDEVLREVASRCIGRLREVDIFGRYGGEEFVALLPETDLEGASAAAGRLRRGVSEAMEIGGKRINATVSIGVSSVAGSDMALEDLLNLADNAMYRAKENGRNRVCVADGG